MNYLEDYRNQVIKPLENMKIEVIKKCCKTFFFKKYYGELLNKIEDELLNKYQKYYEMSVEDYKFQEYIKSELEKDT